MILTADEIEDGAQRLAKSQDLVWDDLSENHKRGLRMIVTGLAEELEAERSPEAIHVFLLWMGGELDPEPAPEPLTPPVT